MATVGRQLVRCGRVATFLALAVTARRGAADIEDFVWVAGSPDRLVRFDLGGGRHKIDAAPAGASGIAIGTDGSAYVAAAAGVFRIDSRGQLLALFPTAPGAHSVAVDVAGDVWVTTSVPGRTVERFSRDGERVLALTGFENPTGLAADPAGGVWVVDSSLARLTRLRASGEVAFSVPGGGCAGDVVVDRGGNAWVADTCGSRHLLRYSPDGELVSRLEVPGFSIGALAVDGHGRVLVTHPSEPSLSILSPTGDPIRTLDLADVPVAVAVDGFGSLWVTGAVHGTVTRIDPVTLEPLAVLAADSRPTARGDLTGFTLANVTLPDADFDGDGYPNAEEIAAGTNPFSRASRPHSWLAGNVNARLGRVTDVLFVNDEAGDARRTVTVPSWVPLFVHVDAPPASRRPAAFVLWARRGDEAPDEPVALPRGIGDAAFPVPLAGPAPGTVTVANSFAPARRRRLGRALLERGPAPATILERRRGLGRRVSFRLQGVIEDPGAYGPGVSVTNAVFVRIE